MNNWGVYLVIVSLLGFLAIVLPPVVKLNNSITRLNTTIDILEKGHLELKAQHSKDVADLRDEGARKRERIHNNIDKLDHRVDDHEKRITVLEERK